MPLSVRDREDLVRGEEPEGEERDRDAERHAGDDVGGMVDAEVEPGADETPTTIAPTTLAIGRGRPGTTSVYRTPTTVTPTTATGADGIE